MPPCRSARLLEVDEVQQPLPKKTRTTLSKSSAKISKAKTPKMAASKKVTTPKKPSGVLDKAASKMTKMHASASKTRIPKVSKTTVINITDEDGTDEDKTIKVIIIATLMMMVILIIVVKMTLMAMVTILMTMTLMAMVIMMETLMMMILTTTMVIIFTIIILIPILL